LISIFAISIHKSQKLTLSLMMFNFRHFDDCSKQSYVALFRVKSIEHVAFELRFFYDHFFKKISKTVMKRIQNVQTKQKLEVQTNVLNVLENMNSFQKLKCISSQWSKFIIIEIIIVSNTNVAFFVQCSSIRERCLHLSLIEAICTYLIEQINVLIDAFVDAFRFFYWRLKKNDAIVNVLSRYFLFHRQNNQWIHAYINFRLKMQFDVNAIILINLLNDQWIYSFVIVDVLSQLIVFSEEVQLLSFDLTQMICQKIDQKSLIFDHYASSLEVITNTIIWFLHVANDHWCVIKFACVSNHRMIIVYNSLSKHENKWLDNHLLFLLKFVIEKNSSNVWNQKSWFTIANYIQRKCSMQMNDSNCEIYTIHNAFALTRRQESSLELIESKLLRLEYVDALITACF
jgi:hypothetical protein